MRKKTPITLLLLLWLVSACQVFPGPAQSTVISTKKNPLSSSPSITPGPTATSTYTPTVSPTATLTPTLPPTATPTIQVTPSAQQIDVFEQLWKTIKDEYLYTDLNGLDWEAIHSEYLKKVEAGLTETGFNHAMNEMIGLLGDDHSVYLGAQEVRDEEAKFAGENDYVGIGVLMTAVPERDRAVILAIFPGSPAQEASLRSRDSILQVNGEAILDQDGFIRDIVRGPEGSSLRLTVQTPGQEPREISLNRQRISGPTPVPYQLLTTPNGKRIGYILVVTLNDSTIDEQVTSALSALSAEAPLDGLILDNRQNTGGADSELRGLLGLFTSGTLGNFVSRTEQRPLVVDGRDVAGSQKMPLTVLVGPGTVSYGEVLTGVLQDIGRAYVIGETSDGNVETLWGYDFEDGSRAWLAHESFRPINHPEQNWEETGIIPDLAVPLQWDQATTETDPAILSSLDYFDTLP
jgi:carboxyl-terminal processing protease